MNRRPHRDDDDDYMLYMGIGTVHQLYSEKQGDRPAGRLLVPDPEQRSGWREYYVAKPADDAPARRPIGFGR